MLERDELINMVANNPKVATKLVDWLAAIHLAVHIQAKDEGLWFYTDRISEAYLQRALRNLHEVCEKMDSEAYKAIKDSLTFNVKRE